MFMRRRNRSVPRTTCGRLEHHNLQSTQVCRTASQSGSGVRHNGRSSWQYLIFGSRSLQIPLSAFVVEDMMEFVQAHASYRFVIRDEEDEKPRMLVGSRPTPRRFSANC